MSEQNTTTTEQTTDAPAKAPKTNGRDTKKYTVSAMAIERAKRKNIDTSKAAKEIRSRLRANFDTIVKLDPSVSKVKSAPNDGNRWPAMNAKVREFIINGKK